MFILIPLFPFLISHYYYYNNNIIISCSNQNDGMIYMWIEISALDKSVVSVSVRIVFKKQNLSDMKLKNYKNVRIMI